MSHAILVVDDNEALRENLAECLSLEGYSVEEAPDGEAALERLARDPLPDVVIVDLVLPRMDGRELVTRIRADPRLSRLRLVISTGLTLGADARLGADHVLQKPYGMDELIAIVRTACAELAA